MRALLALVVVLAAAAAAAAVAEEQPADLKVWLEEARALAQWLTDTRREFHQYPELMFQVGGPQIANKSFSAMHKSRPVSCPAGSQEHNTSANIRRYLDEMGVNYT
jgi:hypothetical protein